MPVLVFDLASAKDRLGIVDASKDDAIAATLLATVAAVERYLDRGIAERKAYVEEHFYLRGGQCILTSWLYPIDAIIAVADDDNQPIDVEAYDTTTGLVYLKNVSAPARISSAIDGGYNLVDGSAPADLMTALWIVFDALYSSVDGGSGGVGLHGSIESISAVGIGTVKYSSGSAASGGTDGGLIPLSAAAILASYRRHTH